MKLSGVMLITALKLKLFNLGVIVSNHIVINRPQVESALLLQQLNDLLILVISELATVTINAVDLSPESQSYSTPPL